ncbi:ribosomal protein L29 [Orientia tsutsugamushi str. UT144]|uniref:Large ribosomal subunit protein uL29 n=1 Tax=Orientia tsutsugamushi str. UT144 TaxID=1441384 RepID=A0A0F3RIR9_ORITS|nr:50S ribosomal protein L29 [Orientia tsutsugamushi]KJW05901.1 ribosomal protein L29 [Orientia tsutsugamushi str. UT144]
MNEFKKYSDLCNIELQDLSDLLLGYKKKLFNDRFQNSFDVVNSVKNFGCLKKKIAQIKTEISQRIINKNEEEKIDAKKSFTGAGNKC